jgi:hypothetical protein
MAGNESPSRGWPDKPVAPGRSVTSLPAGGSTQAQGGSWFGKGAERPSWLRFEGRRNFGPGSRAGLQGGLHGFRVHNDCADFGALSAGRDDGRQREQLAEGLQEPKAARRRAAAVVVPPRGQPTRLRVVTLPLRRIPARLISLVSREGLRHVPDERVSALRGVLLQLLGGHERSFQ